MALLALTDWQLVVYSAPVVLGVALLVLALLRWSEGPGHAEADPPPTAESSKTLRASDAPSRPASHPAPTGSRWLRDQVVACPECALRLAASQLNRHRYEAHGTVRRCPLCNQYIRADKLRRHNLRKHGTDSKELLQRPSLQCPRCHNRVLRANIRRHLNQVHCINFRPAVGWHPMLAALYGGRDGFWLIDALNIVRLQGEDVPRFDFLLALTHHMLRQREDFLCVFDASARPCIRELQGTYFAELCEQLIRAHPRRFSEVPSGQTADEAILDASAMLGQRIVTNDKFRDHAERYPWLESEGRERLFNVRFRHSSRPHRELLVWQDATIPVPPPQKVRTFVHEYRRLLSESEKAAATARG
jgi:hypothetical protein